MLEKVMKPGRNSKAKTWWNWNKARGKTKRDWSRLRIRQKMQPPWVGMAGGLFSGAAGIFAFFALKKRREGGNGKSLSGEEEARPRP